MKQITITMQDDGRITVESPEMEQPYECSSAAECVEFIGQMLEGEGEMKDASAEEMWNEEASSRQPQPGLMA